MIQFTIGCNKRLLTQVVCAQLKNGDVRAGVNVAAQLLAPQRPEAAQHFGYAVLQHLVRIPVAALPSSPACAFPG